MKLRTLLPSIIFLMGALSAKAQITEMYYQGFEVGDNITYSADRPECINYSSSIYMGGSRALKLDQSTNGDVTFVLDTLDFTQDNALRYISLEFNHICAIRENSNSDFYVGRIYYKRANQNDNQWTQLTSQHYNTTDRNASNEFQMTGTFSRNSYTNWLDSNPDNEDWIYERFDLNNALPPSLSTSERKLIIKFVLRAKTHNQSIGSWYLDNIKINASPSLMIKPVITMFKYPEALNYPSSRGADVILDATTAVTEGINPDSVYIIYRIGSSSQHHRLPMSPVSGINNRYSAHIPFEGYDTSMYFYCVARDASTNANQITFPAADNTWIHYRCIRGKAQPGILTPEFTGTSDFNFIPFPARADHRSEWVYDSALMANAGYEPGSITAFRFTLGANVNNNLTRSSFRIKMKNIPTNYTVDQSAAQFPFTDSYMQTVYNGPLTINASTIGTSQTIQLQDTFHYAGGDILMQASYNDVVNGTATTIKMIPTAAGKATIWYNGGDQDQGINGHTITPAYTTENRRPAFVFTQEVNLPLLYDLGISELLSPSYETPMVNRPGSLSVRLKNFGAHTANAIRISYSIDNGTITGHYDWSGTINANQSIDVVIANNNITLDAGYHTLRVWVEDTLRAGTTYYRDHEPYNDTAFSQFIVCDGPMNGQRNIGGTSPDFNNIEEFLFALSRCGIGDSLLVNLAPGQYPAFNIPQVAGLSSNHYIVFRPASSGVTFYADETTNDYSIVNLEQASNIRFRDINFVRRSGPLANMVVLGDTSNNCYFERCTFTDSLTAMEAAMRIGSMINSGFADGMVVDGCTFTGGDVGVNMKGIASDILSENNIVQNSTFYNQEVNAVSVQNQRNAIVQHNEMYDVMTNSSYVLLVYECQGATRILANKIYTSHGAGAIGVSNVIGSSTVPALIANNMIVNNDDGHANMMTSPLNVIQASWTDVVYNSVKMTAPSRGNAAAATFGGGILNNSRFMNNIVVCLDNNNYALNYTPLTSSTNITIGHNVYYTVSGTLCRMAGNAYANITNWRSALPSDSLSISTNPNFLNGSLVDLRTYNRLVKGVGLPMPSVPTDMFDSLRSSTATCPGAFEFVSLGYDFEPEALVSPEIETCYMPSSVELAVLLRNSGVNAYTGSGLSIAYQVNGGAVNTVAVSSTVPAEDTITIRTGQMLSLPPNGRLDATYYIRVWTTYGGDPNQTNDTNTFTVLSKYHPAAPTAITLTPNYATTATITPTAGIERWSVYGSTAAPQRPSTLYWYRDSTDAEPFHVGPSFTTDTLRTDTAFYLKQRRNMPIVRITQLEIGHGNNVVGLTPNMPYWMQNARKVALQLTNIGDATAHLEGDTLMTVSPTSNINNKIFVFGDVTIEPGQSIVVQYVSGTSVNPTMTVHTGTQNQLNSLNVTWSSHVAFVYRRGGVIEDLVAINTIASDANWSTLARPSYIWTGNGVNIGSSNVCGLIRTNFNGSGASGDWMVASPSNPMFLHTNNPAWIRYVDNGCDGYFGKVTINLANAPANDLHLSRPVLPEPQCGMGDEDVTITVHNYGIQPVTSLTLNYWAGGDTVSETIATGIPANGVITHTFAQQLNMAFDRDSVVTVKVWADALATDHARHNDTSRSSTVSIFTPQAPIPPADRIVFYADRDTITMAGSDLGLTPVWYDYSMEAVDTGYTHITDLLYTGGTMGVAYVATTRRSGIIGTGTSVSGDSDPNPYNVKHRYARQQFIYSPSELRAAGLKAGSVEAIHFYLDTVGNASTQTLYNYTIGIGQTTDTIFSSNGDWRPTQTVYSANQLTITDAQDNGWVRHAFNPPYEWDGESSMVVEVNYTLPAAVNNGSKSRFSTDRSNASLIRFQASEITSTTQGSRPAKRPNIMFDTVTYGCVGPISTFDVTMTNIPPVDMALYWPNHVDTLHYNSCDSIEIYVNLRNQGSSDRNGATVYYYLDSDPVDSLVLSNTIISGQQLNTLLLKKPIGPGRHTVTAIVHASGDITSSNDTIRRSFIVHFCRGTYTIALSNGDYSSFGEAIDTLNVAGIEGPVVFQVAEGTYIEQVVLNNIKGSDDTNTISFVGTGDAVLLTAATSQTSNYVMQLDSASNVVLSNFRIESRPTLTGAAGNFANALVMKNGANITLDSMTIRVKGTINATTASCVVLDGNIDGLNVVNSLLDSGYYSVKSTGAGYNNINILNNTLRNFWFQGVNLRNVTNLDIRSNYIRTGVSTNNRALTGIYLAQADGGFSVQKNHVYLIDRQQGAKRGIQVANVTGTSANPAIIANNMVGTDGSYSSSQISAGIWIDSASTNVTLLFNSVRVNNNATGANSDKSYGLYTGATVSNIQVMNNLLSNFGKGYAYYVSELNTVTLSNYNGYFSTGNRPFRWKNDITSLSALQVANSADGNSVYSEPYFMSEDDLHLLMTNFVALAQPNDRVTEDIDGKTRPIIPVPTIGAHEMEIKTHDMAVVRIVSPTMPTNVNNFSVTNMPPNIESDDVLVTAQFYNNGRSTENNVQWYAYIEGYETETRSTMRSLGTVQPGQMKRDSLMMPTIPGIVDTARVRVAVVIPVDSAEDNNNIAKEFFLAPAYNFEATQVLASPTTPSNCYRQNTTISIKLTNKGFKTLTSGTPVTIGYMATQASPNNITVSTLPASAIETVQLPQDVYIGNNVTLDFATPANLYPTGHYNDITVSLYAWCNNAQDVKNSNDTTNAITVQSYYTPAAPVGYDTTLNYGTWGAVRASQENNLAIKWYRDSTENPFYQPSAYAASTLWSNTPQYFSDSVYYLACRTNKQCQSPFSEVWVHVDHSVANDIAFEEVLAPLGSRVYMENDTVRVRISNYGYATQSNVPITYQLKRGANVIQQATEICPATIASGQSAEYTFSELLNIPTPTQTQNYTLTIWTDLATDGVRRNDTIRNAYVFRSLAESTYEMVGSNEPSFDITRVSYNEINLDMPALGRGRSDLASYDNPDYPVLHVTRGSADTLMLEITALDPDAQAFRYKSWVMIDLDRSGAFSSNEVLVNGEVLWNYEMLKSYIAIPASASYGYMRMRICAGTNADFPETGYLPIFGIPGDKDGHTIDLLLFVEEEAPETDLAITQILAPRNFTIADNQPVEVSFRIVNKGATALSNIVLHYQFDADTVDPTAVGTVNFGGTLQPGQGGDVVLPPHVFPLGTSKLTLWHSTTGDTIHSNDTLRQEYHRFHTIQLVMDDNFDEENLWYAPVGYNNFTRNYWQLGTPNKIRINAANSEPNAWVTDLNTSITAGRRGNASYLYSPIIDISQVKPDTISFYLRRNLTGGSALSLEFLNFENRWVKADHDSATNWYNNADDRVFDGNTPSSGSTYTRYWLSSKVISGEFQEKLRFRFVYTTPYNTSTTTFGEGCAIDDFRIGRAPRPEDVGVVDIIEPTITQYGRTYYPKVLVHNFGTDTARSFLMGYNTYGSFLARESMVYCTIAPGETDTVTFENPFVVTSDFPEQFSITAYTNMANDIYHDNDTVTKDFTLSPLTDDISAVELLYPLGNVIAGDTAVQVTLRIRNFGENSISHATASYIVNDGEQIVEEIDFASYLGRPLGSLEYFNYTFQQQMRAPMGLLKITGIIKSEQNEYVYNDTIVKRVRGVSMVQDLAAGAVIVDNTGFNSILIQLKIENRGSMAANGFKVGFILDDDTNTLYTETYSRQYPIPGLSTAYHMFNVELPDRPMKYPNVLGFVHIPGGDNDPSNDSTKVQDSVFTDLAATMIQVEETGHEDCRVRLQVVNTGNLTIVNRALNPRLTVNGTTLNGSFTRYLRPGDTTHLEFERRIPKSPTRTYSGSADLRFVDKNEANNQTSNLRVLNHFEGVPVVVENELALEQNFPNPFTQRTTIPFVLPNAAKVRFFIIDAMGHMVNSFERHYDSGRQTIELDMSQYSSGVYFYGIEVDGQRRMKKMIMR